MEGLTDVELHLVDSLDEANAMMRWLGERHPSPWLAIDTETTGLDTNNDRVRLVQIGDSRCGWSIPWERWSGLFVEFTSRYNGEVVMHNSPFDVAMLSRELDVDLWASFAQVHDTRTMAHLVDPLSSTALKPLAARYVDRRAASMQSKLDEAVGNKGGWTWATVPIDYQPYWSYAALDTVLTCRIAETLWPTVQATSPDAYAVEIAVLPVLAAMQRRGCAVDVDHARATAARLREWVQSAQTWCRDTHDVSPTSDVQVISRLQHLGVVLTKRTKSGARFALDREVLDELTIDYGGSEVGQLVETVRWVRRRNKLVSTYLDTIANAPGGRLYGKINPLGAKTGRMSISDPGLQTLPRADGTNPDAIEVRNCFTASEGNKLVMIDYDQIELRLTGHYSQDPTIMSILRTEGLDPFTEFARLIFSDPKLEKKDPRRQLTKNAVYAKTYGAGAAKFSLTAGVRLEEGQAFLAMFDQTLPGVLAFQRRVEQAARARADSTGRPYVTTPLGRRLPCEPDKIYKLVNYLIQGASAEVLKRKLIELDMSGFGEYLVLPVHDEVIFEFPEAEAVDLAAEAAHIMRDDTWSVPVPVGVDGPYDRWGSKYS